MSDILDSSNDVLINGPLVSVGIPTYNRPDGLRRTLECITGQTYRNLEIIVSDNCSPNPDADKVGKEFAQKDPRIQYFRQKENTGGFNFKFVLQQLGSLTIKKNYLILNVSYFFGLGASVGFKFRAFHDLVTSF